MVNKLQKTFIYFSIINTKIISFFINCYFWCWPWRWSTWHRITNQYIDTVSSNIKLDNDKINVIKNELKKFTWKSDGLVDWFPWLHTLINRAIMDDCDGATIYAIWLMKQAGYKSKFIRLFRKWETWSDVWSFIKEYINIKLGKNVERYWTVGHAISVYAELNTNDKNYVASGKIIMTSNGNLVQFQTRYLSNPPENWWHESVLNWGWHNGRYDEIF